MRHVSHRNQHTVEAASRIAQLRGCGQGKILVIIANGPSILEARLERLLGHEQIHTMSINKPYPPTWPSTYWAFCDLSQYRRHQELWHSYSGIIINSTAIEQQRPNSYRINYLAGRGFSRDLAHGFHIGRSTVFANMQTAYYMGYDNIYVFGVDMQADQTGSLWFYGTNPDTAPQTRRSRFRAEAEFYDHAADLLTPAERQRYWFCSDRNPWPFVDRYNRLDHHTAVDHILGSLP